jgi:hypothetical protein
MSFVWAFVVMLFILRWMVETIVRNIYEQIEHLDIDPVVEHG